MPSRSRGAHGWYNPRMRDFDQLFQALDQSSFRRQFRLEGKELDYLLGKGLAIILEHAAGFIEQRLAPANPPNDGRQTPMRNHPVFIAQHATATCCRGCLQKWHGIPKGRELRKDEKRYALGVIERWLARQAQMAAGGNDLPRSSAEASHNA
ncbi:MAG: hypothetical protein JMDDDDMK_01525 [Acidobacteria bacterium]|nr:hypothetical protein [Acidobacteriota bacterium]